MLGPSIALQTRVISALMAVGLTLLPATKEMFPFWVIARGAFVADALFHEMGHTIFYWLFGHVAIPMIFTLFGSDQAGGMSMAMGRNWFLQILVFAALAYGVYWVKENWRALLIPYCLFSVLVTVAAFTKYTDVVIAYMGHGSSIAMGGFFLFRAWIYLDARNSYERWLNAFFGFYLTLSNMVFSYGLAFNTDARGDYSSHLAFGAGHNDFWNIAMVIPSWSVKGIAMFTIGYGVAMIIGSCVAAAFLDDYFEDSKDL